MRNNRRILAHIISNQHCTRGSSLDNKARGKKVILVWKEEIKTLIWMPHNTLCKKIQWSLLKKKLLELITHKFSQVEDYMINIWKSMVFLYSSNKQLEIEIIINFSIAMPFMLESKYEFQRKVWQNMCKSNIQKTSKQCWEKL